MPLAQLVQKVTKAKKETQVLLARKVYKEIRGLPVPQVYRGLKETKAIPGPQDPPVPQDRMALMVP